MASSGEAKMGAQGSLYKDMQAWASGGASLLLPMSGGDFQISKVWRHLDPVLLQACFSLFHGSTAPQTYMVGRIWQGRTLPHSSLKMEGDHEELETGHAYLRDIH